MKALGQEFRKLFRPAYILLIIVGVLVLCLVETGYADYRNGTEYTVLSLIAKAGDEKFRNEVQVTDLELWCAGTGQWLVMFLPAVASSGYLLVLSEEQKHRNRTFMLMRSGITRYCVSKAVSACIVSGLCCMAGYAVYGLLTAAVFPHISRCGSDITEIILMQLGGTSVWDVVWKRLLGMFAFGMACALPGYVLGFLFSDKYVLVCVPVLVSYLYGQVMNELTVHASSQTASIVCNAANMQLLKMGPWSRYWYITVGIMILLWATGTLAFTVSLRMKRSKGVLA